MAKNIPLNEFWKKLIINLVKKQKIRNWTMYSNYLGKNFEAQYLNDKDYIAIYLPGNDRPQKVYKKSIEKIYPYWDEYTSKVINKTKMMEKTNNKSMHSKYVISILHQYENLMRS